MKVNWDALGVTTSLACAVHCALLPLILSSLPLFGINIINNLPFEIIMIGIAFCIGFYSLYHGYTRHHQRLLPLYVFIAGISFLFAKEIWQKWELVLLAPAVILIVSAHYLNYRFTKQAAG